MDSCPEKEKVMPAADSAIREPMVGNDSRCPASGSKVLPLQHAISQTLLDPGLEEIVFPSLGARQPFGRPKEETRKDLLQLKIEP